MIIITITILILAYVLYVGSLIINVIKTASPALYFLVESAALIGTKALQEKSLFSCERPAAHQRNLVLRISMGVGRSITIRCPRLLVCPYAKNAFNSNLRLVQSATTPPK